jgi:hypothetical protein
MLAVPGAAAQAPLTALSESVVFDPVTGQVTFTLVFNRRPDFEAEDSFGRQADSFQYYIVGDRSLPYPAYYDAIIRGEEIEVTSGLLPVRNSGPPDPDPVSGGWGAVRDMVPYTLNGNVLTFSTSLGLISEHSVDRHFSYELLLTPVRRLDAIPPGRVRRKTVAPDLEGPVQERRLAQLPRLQKPGRLRQLRRNRRQAAAGQLEKTPSQLSPWRLSSALAMGLITA